MTQSNSVYRRIKRRLTTPQSKILLRLPKNNFMLGEEVNGILRVTSDAEFDAEEIRAELLCVRGVKDYARAYSSI
jgi:hypothetical protein